MAKDSDAIWAMVGQNVVLVGVIVLIFFALTSLGSCMTDGARTKMILPNGRPCWCSNNENEWHEAPTADGGVR